MHKFIYILCGLIFSVKVCAQSISRKLIASNGEFFSNASGSISWSIGEISTETYSSTTKIITQGFQQPDSLLYSGINEMELNSNFLVFPNPTTADVYVYTGSNVVFEVSCSDVFGKSIYFQEACFESSKIKLLELSSGVYFITISIKNSGIRKVIKCIKL